MKIKAVASAVITSLTGLMFMTSSSLAQPWNPELGCGRVVDVGMFMIDYSGSMSKEVEFKDLTKIDLALRLTEQLVTEIPQDAQLQIGLSTFAPQTIPIKPRIQNVEEFSEAIRALPHRLEVFGRMTNFGEGLMGYLHRIENMRVSDNAHDKTMAEVLSHQNSLIVVTDGGRTNRGRMIEDVWERFNASLPEVKPVMISFATTEEEKSEVENLTKLMKINHYDGRELLSSKNARRLFIEKELYKPCPEIEFNFNLSADTLFAFDSDELSSIGKQTIAQVAETLKNNQGYIKAHDITFSISAHTDRIGTENYNFKLSDRRLAAVLQALEHNGVELRLFTVRRSEGESRSITGHACRQTDRNALIDCLQPDRRVEIRQNR